MKKLIMATSALLLTATFATAQMRPSFKVEAAGNFSNTSSSVKNVENSRTGDMLAGFRVGAGAEFQITKDFYLSPSLQFLTRGSKTSLSLAGVTTTSTSRYNVLEIPVHAGYRFAFAPNMSVSLQAGPYFAYALTGKRSAVVSSKIGEEKIDTDIFKNNKDASRFDIGVGMQAAFEYSRYYAMLGYEQGILDQNKTENGKMNHMNFYVGLGIRF